MAKKSRRSSSKRRRKRRSRRERRRRRSKRGRRCPGQNFLWGVRDSLMWPREVSRKVNLRQ